MDRDGTAATRIGGAVPTTPVFTARWLACAGQRMGEQFSLPGLDGGQHGMCRRQCAGEASHICAMSGAQAQAKQSASVHPRRSRRSNVPVTPTILPQAHRSPCDPEHEM